jgi:hypothetical protein
MSGKLNLASVSATPISSTGNGEMAKAGTVKQTIGGQQLITTGDFKGLMGTMVSFLVKASGTAPGGAKTNVQATLYLYQVPLFQFGVFYQGNLEITPGPSMFVQGPVHTNGNAYFRAYSGYGVANSLTFQGPVTVTGKIYQWVEGPPDGRIFYYRSPDSAPAANQFQTGLTHYIASMGSNRPGLVKGTYNIDYGTPQLNLPIGGADPHELIKPCTGSESPALKKQKFDCLTDATGRFINGVNPQPLSWIPADSVFFDRREDRWVHVWCVNVSKLPPGDSIFYLYDSVLMTHDQGTLHDTVINAFKLYNASQLTRNLSIASGNPIYVEGSFNAAWHGGPCKPVDYVGTVPDSEKYCNTMIACDAFTLLSPDWSHNNRTARGDSGTLEQPFSNSTWASASEPLTTLATNSGGNITDAFSNGSITLNAAILTGEKPTDSMYLNPWTTNTADSSFEPKYEGGWHNTIRFLENWAGDTVYFRGSFVCMWSAQTKGLRLKYDSLVFSTKYYAPPTRNWGFDPRFSDINNMPPGTPFLSTGIYSNWLQSQ